MIRKFEEMSMNAWPALRTNYYDGWIIRFANKYSKRANSVAPIYHICEDAEKKIDICEKIYSMNNQKTIFKITPVVFPENLDEILENRGYKADSHTSVQLLQLDSIKKPQYQNIKYNTEINDEWLKNYCRLNNVKDEDLETLSQILTNITSLKYYVILTLDNNPIACGIGVIEGEFVGIFDIVVDRDYRNRGYGEQLILNIFSLAKKHGVKNAYLQVMLNNPPALRLYEKLGFKEVYKYWYRLK